MLSVLRAEPIVKLPADQRGTPLIPFLPARAVAEPPRPAPPSPYEAALHKQEAITAEVEDIHPVPFSPISPTPTNAAPGQDVTAVAATTNQEPAAKAPLRLRAARPAAAKPTAVHRIAHSTSSLFNLAAIGGMAVALIAFGEARIDGQSERPTTAGIGPDAGTAGAAQATPERKPDAARAVPSSQQASLPAPVPASEPMTAAPSTVAPEPMPVAQDPAPQTPPPLPTTYEAAAPQAAAIPPTQPIGAPLARAMEKKHLALFDDLIAPVRDAPWSIEDATRLRDAFAPKVAFAQSRSLRDQLKEPAARKLIEWALARGGNASARETKTFLDTNPDWPSRDILVQRAEEQLFVSGGSVGDIKGFFDKGEPKTGIGLAALASAFLAEGDEARATKLARAAWRRSDLPANLEAGFLERFGRLLKESDHKARFDTYLIDNTRWMPDRTERANVARRMVAFFGAAERQKAEARLAAYLRQPAADAMIATLPSDAMTSPGPDVGLAFQLSQWNRRGGRLDAALKILREVPTVAAEAGNLDEWWEERRGAAYDALKAGKPQVAYDLVKAPGTLTVNPAKDQTFLAGFIALRHLKDPKLAEAHFASLETVADGPLSRAKAGYWLARTYEAQNAAPKMRAPLERAARNVDTFYGQLARLELDPKLSELKITPPRTPTLEEAKHFNGNELVRAAVLSRKSNLDRWVTRALLNRLSQTLDNEAEHGLLAHLAEALGDTQAAVHIGKAAVARGFNLLLYSYPIHGMPAYSALRPAIEPALMLAITRQETEFDTAIVSGAGARGLMQVMKVTAEQVCTDYKFKCELDRLSKDPAYNVMMASAYIADRLDEFKGSYVLTIPGYNAGPGRVRQWLREFGDPRTSAIEPIDWIHRIPFEETREYVQKVLSNLQIYRARLGDEATALRLLEDLRRSAPAVGRRAAVVTAAPDPANN